MIIGPVHHGPVSKPGDIQELSESVEQVSRNYAEKFGIERDPEWFLLKLHEEMGELTQAFLAATGQGRAKGRTPQELRRGLEDEVADVLAHVLLLARHHGIDAEAEVRRKWLTYLEAS